MDREEVLRRSRQEKRDEGMERVADRGRKAGYAVCAVIYLIVAALDSVLNTDNRAFFAVSAVVMGVIAATELQRYRFTKNRYYLMLFGVFLLLGAAFWQLIF